MKERSSHVERSIGLDRALMARLQDYFLEREDRIVKVLFSFLSLGTPRLDSPDLPLCSQEFAGVQEGVNVFLARIKNESQKDKGTDKDFIQRLNASLWDYVSVLEACVDELFQQVKQIPIDCWHLSIGEIVPKVRESIALHINQLSDAIKRLEGPLKKRLHQGFFSSLFEEGPIDRKILNRLSEANHGLQREYTAFARLFDAYQNVNGQVEKEIARLDDYSILALLESSEQNLYIDLFGLIKTLASNQKGESQVNLFVSDAIKRLASIENVFYVCSRYYKELKEAFFSTSLEWKALNSEGHPWEHLVDVIKTKIEEYKTELHDLIYLVSHYRRFLLKTDPNPYIRSRWGFTEWTVAPEPVQAKKFIQLLYSCEELQEAFDRFSESLKLAAVLTSDEEGIKREINQSLHDMGQPLISKEMMRGRVYTFLKNLDRFDEMGNPHLAVIEQTHSWLAQAMKEDWKYNMLHEFPLFQRIYTFHKGLEGAIDDPAHAFRIERLQRLFNQIEEWVEKKTLHAHVHEIECDINDMKSYLQDFLGTVQRSIKAESSDLFYEENKQKLRQELLEYRYLFGRFFYAIASKGDSEIQLRSQFLFVDSYFESIDMLLNR